MYEPLQPYPVGGQMPQLDEVPVPRQVENAVKAMYVGAAATIVGVVIEALTVHSTRMALERGNRHLTATQLSANEHILVIGVVVTGLVAVAAWILIARACRNGRNGARITGTALFGLATLDTLASAIAPEAVAVKACWPVIWLAGLIAVILLWQRPSTAFFKASRPS